MMLKKDTLKMKGARKKLLETVRANLRSMGLEDENVLDAMMKVPRHVFFDSTFDSYYYRDTAFQIGAGQTISQPTTVAVQSALLEIKKRDKVLEVGTGSGYQAAVLLEMGAKVFSIERRRLLYENASKMLPEMGYRPRLFFGDGFKGLPAFAPFDKIIVTCGAPHVPKALIEQLRPGGIAVIPVGPSTGQKMMRLVKKKDGSIVEEDHGDFSFVPMLEDRAG